VFVVVVAAVDVGVGVGFDIVADLADAYVVAVVAVLLWLSSARLLLLSLGQSSARLLLLLKGQSSARLLMSLTFPLSCCLCC
jgi:hypothetical protein